MTTFQKITQDRSNKRKYYSYYEINDIIFRVVVAFEDDVVIDNMWSLFEVL